MWATRQRITMMKEAVSHQRAEFEAAVRLQNAYRMRTARSRMCEMAELLRSNKAAKRLQVATRNWLLRAMLHRHSHKTEGALLLPPSGRGWLDEFGPCTPYNDVVHMMTPRRLDEMPQSGKQRNLLSVDEFEYDGQVASVVADAAPALSDGSRSGSGVCTPPKPDSDEESKVTTTTRLTPRREEQRRERRERGQMTKKERQTAVDSRGEAADECEMHKQVEEAKTEALADATAAQILEAQAQEPAELQAKAQAGLEPVEPAKLPKFRRLPAILVFPNLPLLAFWLLATTLTKNSTSLLASCTTSRRPACGSKEIILAVATLLFVAAVLLLTLLMVVRFWQRFRKDCWKPTPSRAVPKDVGDPLFRLWSVWRVWRQRLKNVVDDIADDAGGQRDQKRKTQRVPRPALRRMGAKRSITDPVQDRIVGLWGAPAADKEEPARTKRLVAHYYWPLIRDRGFVV